MCPVRSVTYVSGRSLNRRTVSRLGLGERMRVTAVKQKIGDGEALLSLFFLENGKVIPL